MRTKTVECEKDCANCRLISRRRFLRQMVYGGVALSSLGAVLAACAPGATPQATFETTPRGTEEVTGQPAATPTVESQPASYILPTEDGLWTPPVMHTGDLPVGEASVDIPGLGAVSFEARQVETMRPDIFQPRHFSLFDVLVHLAGEGKIALDYHFDEELDTHVVDAINGESGWWYQAYYSNGWYESNVFRMDMYPYKNDMRIRLIRAGEQRVASIYETFREEVERLARNGGQVILPELAIRSPGGEWRFEDVVVSSYDVRSDVLQPGVVTALDALISLAEQGHLPNVGLTWYECIGRADPVDNYWVEKIGPAEASSGCGFVYETGPRAFPGFSGSHIHIPADVRATVSPEYALWFWICL